MIIRHLTIQDFGAVSCYETALNPELNILDSRHGPEISTAIAFLLCSKSKRTIPKAWVHPTTRLTAEVLSERCVYTVTAAPRDGQFVLTVTDDHGTEVTQEYQYLLSHCPEQDTVESFDGKDRLLPRRLCWYRNQADAPADISDRTEQRAKLKTFRAHVIGYIKAFRPEPIHCQKPYLAALNPDGQFEVRDPGRSGEVFLSETENKLFLYICFLNISEFWADMEKLRDLHHERKPLVVQNFLEYLDESTDISTLVARTVKLQRQMILLTLPLSRNVKKEWSERICAGVHTDGL